MSRHAKAALVLEILVAYASVRLRLRRGDVRRTLERLRAAPAEPRVSGASLPDALQLGRAVVRVLSVLPTDSRCLMRSLVLVRLLARRGQASRLVLGVAPGQQFAAHAWVEQDRQPLLATGGDHFSRLVEL